MPDSLLSWLIALSFVAMAGSFLIGIYYIIKGLLGKNDVQIPKRGKRFNGRHEEM